MLYNIAVFTIALGICGFAIFPLFQIRRSVRAVELAKQIVNDCISAEFLTQSAGFNQAHLSSAYDRYRSQFRAPSDR